MFGFGHGATTATGDKTLVHAARGVFDNGKWTNYSPDSGLAAEQVHFLVPLTDDRFLVVEALEDHKKRCFLWSPSRKLAPQEQDVLKVKPGERMFYRGVDLDGLHHFTSDGLMLPATGSATTKGRVVVSPQGETRLLSTAEAEVAGRLPVGVYENKHCIFGRLTELRPRFRASSMRRSAGTASGGSTSVPVDMWACSGRSSRSPVT